MPDKNGECLCSRFRTAGCWSGRRPQAFRRREHSTHGGTSVMKEKIHLNNLTIASRLSRLKISRSSEPTRTDWLPMTSYSRSMAIIGLYISCTVFEINDVFTQKSQIFPIPVYLTTPLSGFPWNSVTPDGVKIVD